MLLQATLIVQKISYISESHSFVITGLWSINKVVQNLVTITIHLWRHAAGSNHATSHDNMTTAAVTWYTLFTSCYCLLSSLLYTNLLFNTGSVTLLWLARKLPLKIHAILIKANLWAATVLQRTLADILWEYIGATWTTNSASATGIGTMSSCMIQCQRLNASFYK